MTNQKIYANIQRRNSSREDERKGAIMDMISNGALYTDKGPRVIPPKGMTFQQMRDSKDAKLIQVAILGDLVLSRPSK